MAVAVAASGWGATVGWVVWEAAAPDWAAAQGWGAVEVAREAVSTTSLRQSTPALHGARSSGQP